MTREQAIEQLKTELRSQEYSRFGDVSTIPALRFAIEELERGKPGVWEACNDPARVIHPGASPKEEAPK